MFPVAREAPSCKLIASDEVVFAVKNESGCKYVSVYLESNDMIARV